MTTSISRLPACVFVLAVALLLLACEKKAAAEAPLPNIPAIVPGGTPVAAVVANASAASAVMAGGAGGSANAGGAPGAEGSNSPSTGPANGATAIGGVGGGQATGHTLGGKPAPTAGDGATKATEPAASR